MISSTTPDIYNRIRAPVKIPTSTTVVKDFALMNSYQQPEYLFLKLGFQFFHYFAVNENVISHDANVNAADITDHSQLF